MTDYGHELTFGALLEPPDGNPLGVLDLAGVIERSGLDVVSLSDHPYWPQRLDTLALLTAIAARTSRVTVAANLASLPLRPPTVLARTAATIDALSGGRFELGIGTGAQQMWDLITAEDGPRRTAGESVEALEEAVTIIRALWNSSEPVSFDGDHYTLTGVQPGPAPGHDLGIWIGAYQPRLLALTGSIGDAWVPSSPFFPPDQFAAANQIIGGAAEAAGRSPADVRRVYNIEGRFSDHGTEFLQGPPKLWAEQLADCALRDGVGTFLLYRAGSAEFIQRFADGVAPAVRELVAAERS